MGQLAFGRRREKRLIGTCSELNRQSRTLIKSSFMFPDTRVIPAILAGKIKLAERSKFVSRKKLREQ